MLNRILCGRPHRRLRKMLAAASVLAVAAALVQAATASADYKEAIQVAGAPGSAFLNAAGCGSPAVVIQWTWSYASCGGGGSNDTWYITTVNNNAVTPIYALYNGHKMCMNVAGGNWSSGTQIYAWNCDSGVQPNEQFQIHRTSYSSVWAVIAPAYDVQTCFNVWGGYGNGNPIKLYGCDPRAYDNERFTLIGLT